MRQIRFFALFISVLMLLAACNAPAEHEGIMVESVWARPSPMVVDNGAIYLDLSNHSEEDARLLSASSPACEVTELHTMRMGDGDVMVMEPLTDGLVIPAGETIHLKPGGYHVMCLGKTVDFSEGNSISLTLTFADADPITVEAVVSDGDTANSEHEMSDQDH